MRAALVVVMAAACAAPTPTAAPPVPTPREPAPAPPPLTPAVEPPPPRPPSPRWLRGSTHVHAAPSGDSTTAPDQVVAWYEAHGYDFIVLTDHNRVTAFAGPGAGDLAGRRFVRFPDSGLIVLAGIELTHNPASCDPPPPAAGGKCRVHVNVLGPTARPAGKLEWAERVRTARVDQYGAALTAAATLGGVAQLNHPQWHWGMTPTLLGELVARGLTLMEISNAQFTTWDAGGDGHPSTEALWDAALTAGATLWGVASDDAHHYGGGGRYPAGGGWIMVDAPRDPDAIHAAIAAGRFYASTGVALVRAEVWDGALDIEVEPSGSDDATTITFVGPGGVVLAEHRALRARYPLAGSTGYVRAVIRRGDGARAWVQPVRP